MLARASHLRPLQLLLAVVTSSKKLHCSQTRWSTTYAPYPSVSPALHRRPLSLRGPVASRPQLDGPFRLHPPQHSPKLPRFSMTISTTPPLRKGKSGRRPITTSHRSPTCLSLSQWGLLRASKYHTWMPRRLKRLSVSATHWTNWTTSTIHKVTLHRRDLTLTLCVLRLVSPRLKVYPSRPPRGQLLQLLAIFSATWMRRLRHQLHYFHLRRANFCLPQTVRRVKLSPSSSVILTGRQTPPLSRSPVGVRLQ